MDIGSGRQVVLVKQGQMHCKLLRRKNKTFWLTGKTGLIKFIKKRYRRLTRTEIYRIEYVALPLEECGRVKGFGTSSGKPVAIKV